MGQRALCPALAVEPQFNLTLPRLKDGSVIDRMMPAGGGS